MKEPSDDVLVEGIIEELTQALTQAKKLRTEGNKSFVRESAEVIRRHAINAAHDAGALRDRKKG